MQKLTHALNTLPKVFGRQYSGIDVQMCLADTSAHQYRNIHEHLLNTIPNLRFLNKHVYISLAHSLLLLAQVYMYIFYKL